MPMNDASVKILDWGRAYQESLTTEILRSERTRVTILAGTFRVRRLCLQLLFFCARASRSRIPCPAAIPMALDDFAIWLGDSL